MEQGISNNRHMSFKTEYTVQSRNVSGGGTNETFNGTAMLRPGEDATGLGCLTPTVPGSVVVRVTV